MAKYQKPEAINTIWARDALTQNISKPSDGYIRDGWTQVKPPFEYENWSMNKLHQYTAYNNQLGIPEWDGQTEYQASKSYVQAEDNRIYRCVETHSNRNPASGNDQYWEVFEGNRQATTTRRGTVELANNNEVVSGQRSDIAVTPSALQNKKASTTQEGIVRFATNSEVSQGTRNDVALSPATLQFRSATTSQSGLVELATAQETQEGIRNDLAVTPQSITGIFEALFPVGSVVIRPNNPGDSMSSGGLGFGTWEKIEGRSLIGEGSYTDSNGQNKSFNRGNSEGTFEHGLRNSELPSHSHSASTSSAGSHAHTGATNNAGVHSHGGSTNTADLTGGMNGISETWNDGGSAFGIISKVGGYFRPGTPDSPDSSNSSGMRINASHGHSLNVNNAGNHNHSFTTSTEGSHTHSVDVSSTGGNSRHNNLHPVFAVPMWYRTA